VALTIKKLISNPIKAAACLNASGTILLFFALEKFGTINFLPLAIATTFSLVGPFLINSDGSRWKTFVLSILGALLQFGVTAFVGLVWIIIAIANGDGSNGFLGPSGRQILLNERENFFERRFQKYGFELSPSDEILHASYFTVADDMYSDVLIQSKPELVDVILSAKISLRPLHKVTELVKQKFDTGTYVLCVEKTDAKLVDKKLIALICDEQALKEDMMIDVINPESDPYLIVRYFPKSEIVWLHEVNW